MEYDTKYKILNIKENIGSFFLYIFIIQINGINLSLKFLCVKEKMFNLLVKFVQGNRLQIPKDQHYNRQSDLRTNHPHHYNCIV